MDTVDVANHLTKVLKEICPGIQHDYPLSFIEYTFSRELDLIVDEVVANDNRQGSLFEESS